MPEVSGADTPGNAPIAIFVRADDSSLSHDHGPTVKRAALSAILTIDKLRRCQFQTYWGSLMLPALRWESSVSGQGGGMALGHDPFLLWSSARALCRGDDGRWSTLGTHAPWLLGTSAVYVGVISRLPREMRAPLDEQLRAFSWYIGAMEADLNNSLQQKVFSLIPGWRYSQGWVDQPGDSRMPLDELFEGTAVSGFGLAEHPVTERQCRIPWSSNPDPTEVPVALSALASDEGRTFQESIAAILHQYQEAERPLSFTVGRQQPLVEDLRGKLRDYALNPAHPKGGPKAEFFRRELGLEQGDWKLLAVQLISALQAAEPLKFRDQPKYGTRQQLRFEVSISVIGLNGKAKPVTAAWMIQDDAPVQLITITPGKKIPDAVDRQAVAPAGWAALYNIALTAASRAVQQCRPTPIAGGAEGVEISPKGMVGFAWVRFPDTRTEFVQWLVRTGHASESPPGAQIGAPGFDLDPAVAWAEAMADVFLAAGHPCSVTQELD